MAYKHNDLLSLDPYFDDFDDTKKFLRILFKPGYSVQARELTQLQTLLQNQLSKLGSHIFEDGSQVFGGGVSLSRANYLRVTGTLTSEDPINGDLNYLKNKIIQKTGSTSVRAKVVDVLAPTVNDPFTILILQYLTGTEFAAGEALSVDILDDLFVSTGFTVAIRSEIDFYENTDNSFNDNLVGISGIAHTITVDDGIFYIDGFFVRSTKQTISMYKLSKTDGNEIVDDVQYTFNINGIRVFSDPTNRVGFSIVRKAVTSDEDVTLKDPANGSYNFNAPGGDRYVIDLNINSIPFDNLETDATYLVTEDFIELARVVEGKLDYIRRIPTYSDLIEVFARRTYDESGNYTVKPFTLEVYNHLRKDKFILDLVLKEENQTTSEAVSTPYYPIPGDIVQYKETEPGVGLVTKQGRIISIEKLSNNQQNSTSTLDDIIYRTTVRLLDGTDQPFEANDLVTLYASIDDTTNGPEGSLYKETIYQVEKVTVDRDEKGAYSDLEGAVPSGDDNKMVLSVQPGKAYVFGYEFETINSTNISVDKPRELSSLNGYNLPSNIGNYMIIKANSVDSVYEFLHWGVKNGTDNSLSSAELDKVYFGADYKRITIPYQNDSFATLPVKYWSPLVATERSNDWDSILFVSCSSQFAAEPAVTYDQSCGNLVKTDEQGDTDDTLADKLARPQSVDMEIAKNIGQDNGSKTYYTMSDMSPQTETNISRLVFNEPYHGDFDVAYVPNLPQDITDTELADDFYLDDEKYDVFQILNYSTNNSPSNIRIRRGKAVRWVPSSPFGTQNNSSLFVKTSSGSDAHVFGNDDDEIYNFNVDGGVVFQNRLSGIVANALLSYGSSVKRISGVENIVKITLSGYTKECFNSADQCNTGDYSDGEIVTQRYERRRTDGSYEEVVARGEIVAVGRPNNTTNWDASTKLVLYVSVIGVNDFEEKVQTPLIDNTGGEEDVYSIKEVGPVIGSCGCYDVDRIDILNGADCGRLILVEFKESGQYGNYVPGADVYQYNISEVENMISTGNGYNLNLSSSAALSVGKAIKWNAQTSTLYILETRNRFKIENGIIYQLEDNSDPENLIPAVRYGGRGWNRAKNNFVESGENFIPGNNTDEDAGYIEKVQGVFINISQQYQPGKDFLEYKGDSGGITASYLAKQVYSLSENNYIPGNDFIIGEVVTQEFTDNTTANFEPFYATGLIRAWRHRDPNNPVDDSPTIILIEKTNDVEFKVGGKNKPIVSVNTGVSYKTNLLGTTIEDEYIGEARFKQIGRQTPEEYRLFFMDSKMYNVLDSDERYLLGETKTVYNIETLKKAGTRYRKIADIHPNHRVLENNKLKTIIYDRESNSLLFPIPIGDVIKSVYDLDYRVQKEIYPDDTSSPQKLTFTLSGSNYQFVGGKLNGKVEATDLYEHYILIEDPINTTGTARIIDLLNSNYLVKTNNANSESSSYAELTIENISSDSAFNFDVSSRNYRLYATIDVDPTNTVNDYKRKIEERYFDNSGNPYYETQIRKDENGNYYGIIPVADVIDADIIMDSETDITEVFDFNNGQTDNLYDFAKITLKKEFEEEYSYLENNTVKVYFRYYKHLGSGPFIVNSYSSLNEIPLYTSPNSGGIYRLDSFVDFRPVKKLKQDATSIEDYEFDFFGIPKATESFNMDYDYYLARNYKLMLTRNKKFKVVNGPSSLTPELPGDEENSMTLFNIECPPYVFDCKQCNVTSVDHQRYTMKDIANLEKRIADVEEFVKLSNLEREAQNTFVNDRFKSAIVVDDYSSHKVGEITNTDYNVAIDFDENTLRPPTRTSNIDLNVVMNDIETIGVKLSDNFVTLDYSTTLFEQKQPYATSEMTVNTGDVVQWIGNMKLSPNSDSWFDNKIAPDVISNNNGVNDIMYKNPRISKSFITELEKRYDYWTSVWKGKPLPKEANELKNLITTLKGEMLVVPQPNEKIIWKSVTVQLEPTIIKHTRRGTSYYSNRRTYSIPVRVPSTDVIVDKSIVPFMRTRDIVVSVSGMKPNSRVYPFFDNISIEDNCIQSGNSTLGNLQTNSFGEIEFTFTIPTGKFRTGEKLLVLTDSSSNDSTKATTVAEAVYNCSGITQNKSDLYLSTRLAKKAASSISYDEIDPMAQTFFVDEATYPNGIFIDSVMVFFSAKDNKLPVTLELRPVNNGVPASGKNMMVYPGASVTVNPDDITVNPVPSLLNSNGGTTFKFDHPIHLLPGEHAIVLKTNSSNYRVFVAIPGQTVIESGSLLSNNAYKGSFFRPQNASEWIPDQDTDLMFGIQRCVFEETGQVIFNETSNNDELVEYDLFNLTCPNISFDENITFRIKTTRKDSNTLDSDYMNILPEINIPQKQTKIAKNNGQTVRLRIDMKSDTVVSPIFDIDRINMIGVKNLIDSNDTTEKTSVNYNGELNPKASTPEKSAAGTVDTPRVRYISKLVTLEEGIDANNVNVIIDVTRPEGTNIQAFVKWQGAGKDSSFDDEPYYELVVDKKDLITYDSNAYETLKFTLPQDTKEPFVKFSVKICLYSKNSAVVPTVKNMKVIAVV
jgi:hypothetical protein